jgi:opacity protein-like surface antigen
MKKLLLASALLLTAAPALAQGSHYVAGYVRSDGTYVQGHYQTNPNSTTSDNWSTRGNTNPYTGQPGTRSPTPAPNPYAPPKPACYYNCPH